MSDQQSFSFTEPKVKTSSAFEEAVNMLNPEQKVAVDTIYGPVMVVAGPGTGKTQILGARVGNILLKTDASPDNILCLTYTTAGVTAMKKRLHEFLGITSYQVNVHTFHSLCSEIITENQSEFSDFRELQSLSDIERIRLIREIIDELPLGHPFRRTSNPYNDVDRLNNLFADMQKEGWSPEDLIKKIDDYVQEKIAEEDSEFVYVKKSGDNKKGDIKTKAVEKYNPAKEGAKLFSIYNQKKAEKGYFDYHDMIALVLQKFKEDPDFLMDYQERFQFLLIDEYQDTNGSQNDLIYLLANYDEKPNVFVVGDDDQSIYRFQGANMLNIQEFRNRFSPEMIVLKHNYRSNQLILDVSKALIENNKDRLVSQDPLLQKSLIASLPALKNDKTPPLDIQVSNYAWEPNFIGQKISEIFKTGVPYSEMAVLYRNHAQADNIIKLLNHHGIPFELKKDINAIQEPIISMLIQVCNYIRLESEKPYSQDSSLARILTFPVLDLDQTNVATFSYLYGNKQVPENIVSMRQFLVESDYLDSKGIDSNPFGDLGEKINNAIGSLQADTLQVFFQRILEDFGFIRYIMKSSEQMYLLDVIKTVFDYIKEETASNYEYNLSDFLEDVELIKEERDGIKLQLMLGSQDGVKLMTCHGAKGLEFNSVFVIECVETRWEKKRKYSAGSFSLPPFNGDQSNNDLEELRRLMYVAVTRAKQRLFLSRYDVDSSGKEMIPSIFVEEMLQSKEMAQLQEIVSDDDKIETIETILTPPKPHMSSMLDHEFIDRWLQSYSLSVTGLNKYLACPIRFYYETILRMPQARASAAGFGSAIHNTLEYFAKEIRQTEKSPTLEEIERRFTKSMDRYRSHFTQEQYDLRLHEGIENLQIYLPQKFQSYSLPQLVETEYKIKTDLNGIPINGTLDLVTVQSGLVKTVDYKTGKYKSEYLRVPAELGGKEYEKSDPSDGQYWRQLIFYALLLRNDPSRVWPLNVKPELSFVILDKDSKNFIDKDVEVANNSLEYMQNLIETVWADIKAHRFEDGCDSEYCDWCKIKSNRFVFDTIESPKLSY